MDPITGGLIAGGISGIAGMLNTQANNQNQLTIQQNQSQINEQLLQQQEGYNTAMSNTAYQRASADMQAAGLNPMMMFGSGSAASSPTVSPQPIQAATKTSALGNIAPAINTALSTAVQAKTVDKMTDEIANLKAQQLKTAAETATEERRPALVSAEFARTNAQTGLTGVESDTKRTLLPVAVNEAISAQNQADMNPTARKILDVAGFAGRKASDIVSPVSNLVSSARGMLGTIKLSKDLKYDYP